MSVERPVRRHAPTESIPIADDTSRPNRETPLVRVDRASINQPPVQKNTIPVIAQTEAPKSSVGGVFEANPLDNVPQTTTSKMDTFKNIPSSGLSGVKSVGSSVGNFAMGMLVNGILAGKTLLEWGKWLNEKLDKITSYFGGKSGGHTPKKPSAPAHGGGGHGGGGHH